MSPVDEPVLDRALVAPQRDRVSRPVEVYGDDLVETIAAHPTDEQLAQQLLEAARQDAVLVVDAEVAPDVVGVLDGLRVVRV